MSEKIIPLEVNIPWIVGCCLSTSGLIFQILIYILIPRSRQLDQKLLTQLTVARILNIAFEYATANCEFTNHAVRDVVFAIYQQTDAALICWMFIFTKNLYDKVVNVFTQKRSFTLMSVTVWIVTFPIGLMCPLLLTLQGRYPHAMQKFYYIFYVVYGVLKFIILSVNLILFCKIFNVVIKRSDRNIGILRTCVVSFILICISSVQVFLTDLLSFFWVTEKKLHLVFAVINSYEVIAITIIFVILVNGACEESISKTLCKKFSRENV